MGESGSGKTTISNKLKDLYGLKILNSYTTRPQRHPGEKGHRFVSEEDFAKLKKNMCAYTEFAGYKYCATNRQVRSADVYIIDPAGVNFFKENYTGKKKVITVRLIVDKQSRYERMRSRGDTYWQAKKRLRHDKKAFKDFSAMINISASQRNVEEIANNLMTAVNMHLGIQNMAKGEEQ